MLFLEIRSRNGENTHQKFDIFSERVAAMLQTISEILYIDPQDAIPVGFCPRCGKELWNWDTPCRHCREEESHDPA
jgi:hypothetical protein